MRGALLVLAMAGCCTDRARERRAAEEQVQCVLHVLTIPGLTEHQRADLADGCHDLYLMRTNR